MLWELVHVWGDIKEMARCLFMLSTDTAMVVKYLTILWRSETLQKLFRNSARNTFIPNNQAEMNIVRDGVTMASRVRNLYFVSCLITVSLINLYPILVGSRMLPLPAYYGFDLNTKSKLFIKLI